MRVLTIALLLLTVGLAGCAGDGGSDGGSSSPGGGSTGSGAGGSSSGGGSSGTSGGGSSSGGGSAPVQTGEAHLVPTIAADVESGSAPLTVNFTVDATAYDADGDAVGAAISWSISSATLPDLAAEGSELPASAGYTVLVGGDHIITVTVAADGFGTASAETTIVALYEAVVVDPLALETPIPLYTATDNVLAIDFVQAGIGNYVCTWTSEVGTWTGDDTCTPSVYLETGGEFTIELAVQDIGGSGEVLSEVTATLPAIGTIPTTSPDYSAGLFFYNLWPACVGISNVLAEGAPDYFAGDGVCVSARSIAGADCSETATFYVFDSTASVVAVIGAGNPGSETTGECRFDVGGAAGSETAADWTIPPTTSPGEYYLGTRLATAAGVAWITDNTAPSAAGHKTFTVSGAPI